MSVFFQTLPNEDKCDWFQVHHPTLDEELLEQSTSPKQVKEINLLILFELDNLFKV